MFDGIKEMLGLKPKTLVTPPTTPEASTQTSNLGETQQKMVTPMPVAGMPENSFMPPMSAPYVTTPEAQTAPPAAPVAEANPAASTELPKAA